MRNIPHEPLLKPAGPDTAAGDTGDRTLDIKVLFTDPEETERALLHARLFASGLDARIEVVVPQVVPWPLPLVKPDVDGGVRAEMLAGIVERCDVAARVSVYLCRDEQTLLDEVLPPRALVIAGGMRKARALRRRGHSVIVADNEGGSDLAGRLLRAFHDCALRGLLAVRQSMRSAVR
jgi:hypothetical protein